MDGREVWTHSALDGSEGKHVLGSVAAVSTPGLVARVVSLLQDKLLSLELGVLITHPAADKTQGGGERRKDKVKLISKTSNKPPNANKS